VFDHFDDHGAVRCAVADILIKMPSASAEQVKAARKLLEQAVEALHSEEITEGQKR
jgi:hypothetical protein